MPEPPPVVRAKALEAGAGDWLEELPELVGALERDWGIRVGRVYPDATEALVAEAVTEGGTPAVLKVMVPRDGDAVAHEIAVLLRCGGTGCVALLRHDAARGALLLEQLGPSLHEQGLPLERRHEILCTVAQEVWRPATGLGLPTGDEKAQWLARWIVRAWQELARPCSADAVAHALAFVDRRARAHLPAQAVLVHGDVHEWNALQAGTGYKLVDPDGLEAEPEYDLGVIMREDPLELMEGDPMARAHWLAARTGLDATAIWEWGVVERVSTGLLGVKVGLQPVASQMLAAADRLAGPA